MNFRLNRYAASTLLALAAGPLLMASSLSVQAATADADSNAALLANNVKAAIDSSLGADAKDLTVSVDHGIVTLGGWTYTPTEEMQARAVASRVPGVSQAYSHVHTWATED